MSRQRLIHDRSWAAATVLLDALRECLPEARHQEAHRLFYEVVRASIESLDLFQACEDAHQLRKPSKN